MFLRNQWVCSWAGQAVLCISQLYWTSQITEILSGKSELTLKGYLDICNKQIMDIVNLVRGTSLSKMNRTTLQALIVLEVHARDVLAELIQKNVRFLYNLMF